MITQPALNLVYVASSNTVPVMSPSVKTAENTTLTLVFKCDQCNYEGASEKGVKQHSRLKHRISQLDGQCDSEHEESEPKKTLCTLCPENSGNCVCGKCDECEYFATQEGYSIHIMNQHEPTDVLQHYGMDWINKHFKYVKRNFKYAQDRYHFKKWESFVDGQV